MPYLAKIVDQVPYGRVWCSCYGSGECCKKHTEIHGMHSVRVAARLDNRKLERILKSRTEPGIHLFLYPDFHASLQGS